jgi:peptide-methionine (R)-S-oxide reductase
MMTRKLSLWGILAGLTLCFLACAQSPVEANESKESSGGTDEKEKHFQHVHSASAKWVAPTEEQYKKTLSSLEYKVLRRQGTERAGTGALLNNKADGIYHCRACGLPLYDSTTKFDSGTGWPSFWAAIDGGIETHKDVTFGMVRTELVCARCSSHLGHVFADGPPPTGQRHCINSVSLEWLPRPSTSESISTEDEK